MMSESTSLARSSFKFFRVRRSLRFFCESRARKGAIHCGGRGVCEEEAAGRAGEEEGADHVGEEEVGDDKGRGAEQEGGGKVEGGR